MRIKPLVYEIAAKIQEISKDKTKYKSEKNFIEFSFWLATEKIQPPRIEPFCNLFGMSKATYYNWESKKKKYKFKCFENFGKKISLLNAWSIIETVYHAGLKEKILKSTMEVLESDDYKARAIILKGLLPVVDEKFREIKEPAVIVDKAVIVCDTKLIAEQSKLTKEIR